MQSSLFLSIRNAPLLAGAFFLLFSLTSCRDKEESTARWVTDTPAQEESAVKAEDDAPVNSATDPTASDETVRFLSYNLKNYLTMKRGSSYQPKPENEIGALVNLIERQKPDVLGICEIGTEEDLADLQRRLKNVGIDLPHREHTGGHDKTRHLGLLSRFPIVATNPQRELSYEMEGKSWVISRGILDATLDVRGTELRLLGVHLKSKREIEEADQELIRQNEARLLRNHMDAILEEKPDTLLVAYGDFNDTIKSKALSIARGRSNSKKHMADFYFKDSRQDLWTHFWDYQDVYSRFDYVLFSRAVQPLLVGKGSKIVDDETWKTASDHRALMLVLAL